MTHNPNPLYGIEEWANEIVEITRLYKRGPGMEPIKAHIREDDLLERFVRDRAYEGDPRAAMIVGLLDMERIRWFG